MRLISTPSGTGKANPSEACCESNTYKKYVRNPRSLSVAFRTGNEIRIR